MSRNGKIKSNTWLEELKASQYKQEKKEDQEEIMNWVIKNDFWDFS